MANIKSQLKRIKTNEKARLRNKAVKSSLKTAIRKFREAADAGERDTAPRPDDCVARARQGREQGRHPPEPGGQPQVGDGQAGRRRSSHSSTIDEGVSPLGVAPFVMGQSLRARAVTIAPTAFSSA